jgi:hypothetical protein
VTTIDRYQRELARQEASLRRMLASGKGSASELGVARVRWQIMHQELTTAPKSVLAWDKMGRDPKWGFEGPERWSYAALYKAADQVTPWYGSDEEYNRKFEEYLDLSLEILRWGKVKQQLIQDKRAGKQWLILGENPLVPKINQLISSQLMEWFRAHPRDRELLTFPAKYGLATMLAERADLSALLRLAQSLPLDVEVSAIPVDRPAMVEAVEFAIGIIPVVGNVVAAYEAWSGEDLFGYRLGDLERGILAASVLLPFAGRLAKGGRALYTEARLVNLYGRDAAAWSRALGASGKSAAEHQALDVIAQADRALRTQKSVTGAVAKDAAAAVPTLTKGAAAVVSTVDKAITDLLSELRTAHPTLAALDEFALQRVLAKGPNVDHLKGQLLEELIESRLVPWLAKREAGYALGIVVPAGKKLEFIPGHLVRDAAGRQISDGLLVYRDGEQLVIAAVFEAKAGKHAARELSLKRGSFSSLTEAERLELRANAKDVWLEQRDAAKAAGQPFEKTIEDVEKEYALSELGGQVRRDVERLADGATVRVGSQEIAVTLSPTKTKFFGVLPRDVKAATIEAELQASGYTYEILGVDVTASKLKEIATGLKPLAETKAKAAP